jgi:hypothetical protein
MYIQGVLEPASTHLLPLILPLHLTPIEHRVFLFLNLLFPFSHIDPWLHPPLIPLPSGREDSEDDEEMKKEHTFLARKSRNHPYF